MFALSKASDLSLEFAPTAARRSPGDLRAKKIRGFLPRFEIRARMSNFEQPTQRRLSDIP
jgi:hypothetical protein